VSGLLAANGSRVVLEAQPSRERVLDLLGRGVYAQGLRAEAPGLTQIDFTVTYPEPAPPPQLRFRLRELPDGPERVNVLLTPRIPGRHGYVTVRFPPLPAAAGHGYEFSLEREDPDRRPSLQIWGADRNAYPHGVYRRNGLAMSDRDMTFLASFRMRGWQALGVLTRRLTAQRPPPWNWGGTYVVLLLVYGGALGALLVGLARMPVAESPGSG
jgi:hypothetical protein